MTRTPLTPTRNTIFSFGRGGVMVFDEHIVSVLFRPKECLITMESAVIGLDPGMRLTQRSIMLFCVSGPTLRALNDVVMNDIEPLMRQVSSLRDAGARARKQDEEAEADGHFRDALRLAIRAASQAVDGVSGPRRSDILRQAILLALECGEAAEARRLMDKAREADPTVAHQDEWQQFYDVTTWPDGWLIAAVRREPPDVAALDVLADRYWRPLFGRCQMLTLNREAASDLAQQAWCRVLRARHTLKPGGNFPAFLTTVATNLWRDSHRSARRAGPLAERRLASLDAPFSTDDGESAMLADILPDLNALQAEEQKRLALDIDQALERLTPLLREVLVARLMTGESCAEIGRRHKRTEQTISAWVRQAIREMKRQLEESDRETLGENKS
jgi:RNA polymerase sigma-70 factor (ECF subfamily)